MMCWIKKWAPDQNMIKTKAAGLAKPHASSDPEKTDLKFLGEIIWKGLIQPNCFLIPI